MQWTLTNEYIIPHSLCWNIIKYIAYLKAPAIQEYNFWVYISLLENNVHHISWETEVLKGQSFKGLHLEYITNETDWFLVFQRDLRSVNHSLGNMHILKALEVSAVFLETPPCHLRCVKGNSSWMKETWQKWLDYPYYSIREQNEAVSNCVTIQFLTRGNSHDLCVDSYWSGLGD